MQQENKIVLNYEFNLPDDYHNFNLIIESALKEHNIVSAKKILICSTELIQNNIIHNNLSPSKIEISTNYDTTIIEYSQIAVAENYFKINSLIDTINNISILSIKEKIRNNIIKENRESSCGNGLMICRYKSGNNINVQLINKIISGDETIYYFKIQLKINNNDKDN